MGFPTNISVSFGGGSFIIAPFDFSTNGKISTDGINWSNTTFPSNQYWTTGAYGNGRFVYMSGDGGGAVASNKGAISTDNGKTWTTTTLPGDAQWTSIAYGNGRFVTIAAVDSNNAGVSLSAAYLLDGSSTWVSTSLSYYRNWSSIVYGSKYNRFVAIAKGTGTTQLVYSSDGITWTLATGVPANPGTWFAVGYGNGVYVALPQNGSVAAYSYDGISWVQTINPDGVGSTAQIAYGNGKFMTTAGSGDSLYSYDGITWLSLNTVTRDNQGCAFGNNRFVISKYAQLLFPNVAVSL